MAYVTLTLLETSVIMPSLLLSASNPLLPEISTQRIPHRGQL